MTAPISIEAMALADVSRTLAAEMANHALARATLNAQRAEIADLSRQLARIEEPPGIKTADGEGTSAMGTDGHRPEAALKSAG